MEEANQQYADRLPRPDEVARSSSSVPTLFLEDVSAIPFVDVIPGVEQYQHRARVRAGDGDFFAASTDRDMAYETYNRDLLRLGSPQFALAEPGARVSAATDACRRGDAFKRICDWAATTDRFLIHPYMAIESVWQLASEVTAATGVSSAVVGPPPPTLWIANDKSKFSDVVSEACGDEWVVETRVATSLDALASSVRDFSTRHDFVGAKRTRCASAMGNDVMRADDVLRWNEHDLLEHLRQFAVRTEWDGEEEILIVEWVDTDCSPSTQLWIPREGDPFVEGVYEQLLEGAERVFLGSRPSTLPEAVNESLRSASLQVGRALQALGYVGRCSFDFIVGGDLDGDFRPLFVECNGRWGGTSTPMYLVDRVVTSRLGHRPMYRAQDVVLPSYVGATFSDLVDVMRDDLYDPQTGEGDFILYNVGPLASRGKFDVIALARDKNEADDKMAELVSKL